MPNHLSMTNLNRLGTGQSGTFLQVPSGFALQFDGAQNYVDFGTMGTLGSSLTNGAYASFDIKTTESRSNRRIFSVLTGSNKMAIQAYMNTTGSGSMKFFLADDAAHNINREAVGAGIADGNVHTVVITAIPSTATVTITVDGVSQSLNNADVGTLNTFVDFNQHLVMGVLNNNGTINTTTALSATIDNFKIGVAANNLFGSYAFDEGGGTTTKDVSGKSNTGTLMGSPVPTWVSPSI